MLLGNPLATAALALTGVMGLLAGCGTSGAIDPGVPRGPGPVVAGYQLHLGSYTAYSGDIVTATVSGPTASSSALVEVTCGIRDRRVSYAMPAVTSGNPPRTVVEGRRASVVASARPLRFRVPVAVPQSCTVSRSIVAASGVVQPTAALDVR